MALFSNIRTLIGPLGRYLVVGAAGFAVGATAIYVYVVRSGPPLQHWHTVELSADFTAAQADDITTFEAYRELEDRLLAQLSEEVYDRVGTGPAFTLARFSHGSAADPHTRTPNWNLSFELQTSSPRGGVLLLHGMSDSPYSLRAIGQALNERGYWVVGLRMPGHGTAPSGLRTVRNDDLTAAVKLGADHVVSRVGSRPMHIVGYSTGATLGVDYVLDILSGGGGRTPASLVLISPALGVRQAAALAQWQDRLAALPGLRQLAWTGIVPEFDPYKYNSFTTNAAAQVYDLTRSVASRIETRSSDGRLRDFPPTLVFLSTVDATVSTNAVVDNLLEHLAPNAHELVLFDINRTEIGSTVLVADPGPLTDTLLLDGALPFALTVIANETPDSLDVVSRQKPSLSAQTSIRALGLAWPTGVISLSHVALPFPPDDPLYGRRQPGNEAPLQLGQISVQGELGLLQLPPTWLLRLRHNPFYDFLEEKALDWVEAANQSDRGLSR